MSLNPLLTPSSGTRWAATFTFNLHYLTGVREYFHVQAAGTEIVPPVAHVWSLCVEEHFYWFWPALVWLLPARFYRWLPLVVMAATPALASRGHHGTVVARTVHPASAAEHLTDEPNLALRP